MGKKMGKKKKTNCTEVAILSNGGFIKSKKSGRGFQPGNQCYKKRKNNHGEGELSSNSEISLPETERGPSDRLQEKREAKELIDESNEYFICKKEKMNLLWNEGFKNHSKNKKKKGCRGPLCVKRHSNMLISCTLYLECDNCGWTGDEQKMYDEFVTENRDTRGRKLSTLNEALGLALLNNSIGAAGFTELCLQIGINPGSRHGLADLINRCGGKMLDLGNAVIKETREDLVKEGVTAVDASLDTCFNNPLCSPNTPFAAGTEAVTTAFVENKGHRKVIGMITASKLVTKKRDNDPTIILAQQDNIGCEGVYAEKLAEELKEADMGLKTVASDGDCQIAGGVKKVNKDCEFQSDVVHLSRLQRKKITTAEFSVNMFSNKSLPKITTTRVRNKRKGFFATDVVQRCTAEFNAAHKKLKLAHHSRIKLKQGMKKLLRNVPAAIVDCYAGKHKNCKKHSLVCSSGNQIWEKKSLPVPLRQKMTMTPLDRKMVMDLCLLRLGDKALDKTYLNMNTQICEAFNRKLRKTNPKNVTSKVNFRPRCSSAVVTHNLGFEPAIRRMLSTSNHRVCGSIKQKIKAYSSHLTNMRNHHKTVFARKKRINKRQRLNDIYQEKENQKCLTDGYPSYSKNTVINDDSA